MKDDGRMLYITPSRSRATASARAYPKVPADDADDAAAGRVPSNFEEHRLGGDETEENASEDALLLPATRLHAPPNYPPREENSLIRDGDLAPAPLTAVSVTLTLTDNAAQRSTVQKILFPIAHPCSRAQRS